MQPPLLSYKMSLSDEQLMIAILRKNFTLYQEKILVENDVTSLKAQVRKLAHIRPCRVRVLTRHLRPDICITGGQSRA